MSGPTVGLWLPQERSALDAVPWLEGFCDLECVSGGDVDFTVRDPAALGLPELRQEHPCRYGLGPDVLDAAEQAGYPGLDEPPAAELALVASVNTPEAHLVLGHLALFLAQRFDALVDFGGLLGYRCSARDLTREEEALRLAESRALVAPLPGRVREMPYATEGGHHAYSHVADRTFLAAWLAHPDFRLIT